MVLRRRREVCGSVGYLHPAVTRDRQRESMIQYISSQQVSGSIPNPAQPGVVLDDECFDPFDQSASQPDAEQDSDSPIHLLRLLLRMSYPLIR